MLQVLQLKRAAVIFRVSDSKSFGTCDKRFELCEGESAILCTPSIWYSKYGSVL